ncbi:hypothetical protein ASQ44_07575 (plasmid) [Rickettsia rhipicephali]|nr:hypothetical protein ASQ44_07575 [Rickettsia rhipicephali]
MRIKSKKRLLREKPEKLIVPKTINDCWSMDFMHDSLENGKRYRLFNVIDEFNREGLRYKILPLNGFGHIITKDQKLALAA